MKYMGTWKISMQNMNEASQNFVSSGALPPDGVTILGRWHVAGTGRGFVLLESDDLVAVATHLSQWNHLLELELLRSWMMMASVPR